MDAKNKNYREEILDKPKKPQPEYLNPDTLKDMKTKLDEILDKYRFNWEKYEVENPVIEKEPAEENLGENNQNVLKVRLDSKRSPTRLSVISRTKAPTAATSSFRLTEQISMQYMSTLKEYADDVREKMERSFELAKQKVLDRTSTMIEAKGMHFGLSKNP